MVNDSSLAQLFDAKAKKILEIKITRIQPLTVLFHHIGINIFN